MSMFCVKTKTNGGSAPGPYVSPGVKRIGVFCEIP
jgi:hypothetical protein